MITYDADILNKYISLVISETVTNGKVKLDNMTITEKKHESNSVDELLTKAKLYINQMIKEI